MPSIWTVFAGLIVSGMVAACSILPSLPSDEYDRVTLPVHEIVLRSACELQAAFNSIPLSEYKRFDPRKWLVSVTLWPKVDTEITPGFALTRLVPTTPKAPTLTTLSVGPATQLDGKGERVGIVVYSYKSAKLMTDKEMDCTPATPSMNALAQHLGVGEWLRRTIAAAEGVNSAKVDKPQFNSDITIKFSATGGYSFVFPAGSEGATLFGSYALDEQLNIAMTEIAATTKTVTAVTLPVGEKFTPSDIQKYTVSTVTTSAQSQMDLLQLQQAIQNIQPRP